MSARVIFPIGLATALSLMGDATLYVVLPTHFADAGIALGSVGLILSVNRFIRLLTNGPAGWLFDRVADRRLVFLGSLTLGVFATIIYATTSGLEGLFVARLLWGLAWSGIWIGGTAIVLHMAPESERGRWVGIYQMWFFFGSAVGSLLGGALTDAVGYRNGLWIGAGISAMGAVAAALALSAQHTNNHPAGQSTASWRKSIVPDVRGVSSAMWAAVMAQGVNRLAGAGIIGATMGLIVQQSIGPELQWGAWQIGVASITGSLLSARTLLSLVGAPLAGILSDRLRHRWGLLAASLAIGAVGVIALPIPNGNVVILGTIIAALTSGSVQALTTTLVGDLARAHERGKHLALFNIAGDLGSAIGPLVAYALLAVTGLATIYWASAVLMLGVGMWAARNSETRQRR